MTQLDWNKYIFTQAQLKQYVEIQSGVPVTVLHGGQGGSTHVPTKIVQLDIGSHNAQDVAAHEVGHLKHTTHEIFAHLHSDAERTMFNALEDARDERLEFRTQPGLRIQHQVNRIDWVMPRIIEESWLMQAVKGMYLLSAGYDFPRAKFKAKARKVLTAFEKAGLHWDVRNAATDMDLLPVVAAALALFDEQPVERQPKPKPQPEPEPAPEPYGEHNADGEDGDCTHCDDLDRAERAEKKQDGGYRGMQAGGGGLSMDRTPDDEKLPAGGGEEGDGEEGEDGDGFGAGEGDEDDEDGDGYRDPISYDVDENAARAEAAAKLGHTGESEGGGTTKVNGADEATGGPTVNRLMQGARKLERDMKRMANEAAKASREAADKAKAEGEAIVSVEGKDKSATDASNPDMPEGAKEYADPKTFLRGYSPIANPDYSKLFSPAASGALGYSGQALRLIDARSNPNLRTWGQDTILDDIYAQFGATINYLGRQMEVYLQSQDRTGLRLNERRGDLDARRAYQMGGGRFDVYKYPPNPEPVRPLVVLTVDASGSMGGGSLSTQSPALHAMMATLVMGGALRRIGVPFEVHSFSSSGIKVMKTFDMPWNRKTVQAVANLVNAGGGTPAAEGLAFAWTRALTRPEQRRIVIQVTDGAVPVNAAKMVKAIGIDGGTVIGVGIGKMDLRGKYPDSFTVEQSAELPARFANLLRRLAATGKLR